MTVYFARGFGAALFCVSTAQMAFADLTAQDVWSDWKSYMSSTGYDVTGTENMSGGTLTISDLSMAMKFAEAEAEGAFSVNMSELVFTGNSDGTVTVTMPTTIPIRIDGKDEDGEQFEAEIGYTQSGNSLVVSGAPDDMNYNYTAAKVDMNLSSLSVDGEQMPPGLARVSMTMNNVISSTQMKIADMRSYSQRMSADSLSYDFAFNDPESDDMGEFQGTLQGLGFKGNGKIPSQMDVSDFQAMLKAGFGFEGTFDYTAGSTKMQGTGDGENFSADTSSQGGQFAVAMDSSHIVYDFSQKAAAVNVTTNELPFPISFEMAKAGFRMDIPVAKSDQEQDFSFAVTLGDFTMSDMIWGIFDGGAVLPRDPATILLDISGKAKVLVDFFDPEVAENLDNMKTPPGEVNAVSINQLLVSAVGAKLSGSGQFTFDNTDLETFDGIPAPTGSADLQLVGANGLIDKLIQMGLMSDQDAMGGRMMMGMLAVPGEGPDTLNSKIDINDQGHITANGQRIK